MPLEPDHKYSTMVLYLVAPSIGQTTTFTIAPRAKHDNSDTVPFNVFIMYRPSLVTYVERRLNLYVYMVTWRSRNWHEALSRKQ